MRYFLSNDGIDSLIYSFKDDIIDDFNLFDCIYPSGKLSPMIISDDIFEHNISVGKLREITLPEYTKYILTVGVCNETR